MSGAVTIGFVGGGNMAEAVLKGLVGKGHAPQQSAGHGPGGALGLLDALGAALDHAPQVGLAKARPGQAVRIVEGP